MEAGIRTVSTTQAEAPEGRRTAAKVIYFHPEELARIAERAHASGQTPARFIRETALGKSPPRRREALPDPLLNELAHIGHRLDEIARLAAAGHDGALAEQINAALDRHWTAVRNFLADRRQRRAALR